MFLADRMNNIHIIITIKQLTFFVCNKIGSCIFALASDKEQGLWWEWIQVSRTITEATHLSITQIPTHLLSAFTAEIACFFLYWYWIVALDGHIVSNTDSASMNAILGEWFLPPPPIAD